MGTTVFDKVCTLYAAGDVRRFHTCPVVKEHTIAKHVYGALLWAVELCVLNEVNSIDSLCILKALLYHDAAEVVVGDIPANIKHDNVEIETHFTALEDRFNMAHGLFVYLSAEHAAIVKAADRLDLAKTCIQERTMGNGSARNVDIFQRALQYAEEQQNIVKGVTEFVALLRKEWFYGCDATR